MATWHDLPLELLCAIFAPMEHEPSPRDTLVACSVVSHLWRDVTLPYLFSTLKVRRWLTFVDVISFLSGHPHIAACVKQLWLQSKVKTARMPEVDHDTVQALLARLPALVNLSFHAVEFVGPLLQASSQPQTASPSAAALPRPTLDTHTRPAGTQNGPRRLQLVLLYNCAVSHDPTPLFRILSLCEIETFRATLTQLPEGEDRLQVDLAALHRPLRVQWLRVGVQTRQWSWHPCPPPLLEAFRRCLEPGSIRALELACVNWDAIESGGALLRDVGRNLTKVRLNMFMELKEKDVARERWAALNLSSCKKLEIFEFSFHSWGSDLQDRSGSACASILKLLPAGVRTIVLQLPETMVEAVPEYPRTPGLRELDDAVMERRGRLSELTRVVLNFVDYKKDKFEEWATISSSVMPRLKREGLLHPADRL